MKKILLFTTLLISVISCDEKGAEEVPMLHAKYLVEEEIKKVEEELGDEGRILVRLSGTEPLIRVMLEGKNYEQIKELAESVASVIKERLV